MPGSSRPSLPALPLLRIATEAARKRLAGFPILTITGARQSGKTTLSRLIAPELRARGLLFRPASDGAILDEVQRAPERFSCLQSYVRNLATFQGFVQLCAGRIGQLINITSLAADTGIAGHSQRGALFENWIMTDLLKAQTNLGPKPSLHLPAGNDSRKQIS